MQASISETNETPASVYLALKGMISDAQALEATAGGERIITRVIAGHDFEYLEQFGVAFWSIDGVPVAEDAILARAILLTGKHHV